MKRGDSGRRSERELVQAILDYIEIRNEDPKPFTWVRSADEILDAVKRFCLKTSPVNDNANLRLGTLGRVDELTQVKLLGFT